ncbi:MAG TPA: rhomboid family intramembrane serine protease [Candidatus Corynebacterium gallistercoris]|uniref:Rhomboid family intramembrane serine protease n=1 Tax=Candidatus Corynebacterium gallistercoris TaxID=2838530 RepID=A0A9D1RXA7_9CORY|nr:rhomboid family intramembrane serine protease [Candidatus Corynebacterium gallistercoris]
MNQPGRFGTAVSTTTSFLAVLWAVQLINALSNYRLTAFGIHPRSVEGLIGVAAAPFLHASWMHLIANSVLGAVLLFTLSFSGQRVVVASSVIIAVCSGLGTWLIAPAYTVHVGASGLIFGWLTFLIVRGLFSGRVIEILVGLVVLLTYGSVLWGVFPGTEGISWQGHLFGAVGGVVAAWMLAGRRGLAGGKTKEVMGG